MLRQTEATYTKECDFKELRKAELAGSLAQKGDGDYDGISDGFLLFKRSTRKSKISSKKWKNRYFVIMHRMLHCYKDPYDPAPIRAIQLQHCDVIAIDSHPKYGDTRFDVISSLDSTKYSLRADSMAERTKWVNILKREIQGVPPAVFPVESTVVNGSQQPSPTAHRKQIARDKSKLTASQQIRFISFFLFLSFFFLIIICSMFSRYHHFVQEQIFIKNLTNICDRLRSTFNSLTIEIDNKDSCRGSSLAGSKSARCASCFCAVTWRCWSSPHWPTCPSPTPPRPFGWLGSVSIRKALLSIRKVFRTLYHNLIHV